MPTVHDSWWGRTVAAGRDRDPHEKTAGPDLARDSRGPAATAADPLLPSGYRHHHRTSGTGTCSARCDRDPPDVAHTWVTVCMSAAGRGKRGQSRRTSCTTASLARWSRCTNGMGTSSIRCDSDVMRHTRGPSSAHSAAGRGRRGQSRRASGTGTSSARGDCDVLDAAHAWTGQRTSRRRQWQAGAVSLDERHGDVLGSLRSQRAGCCAHVGRPAHLLRLLLQVGRSRRASGMGTCSARGDRVAPDAALT